MQSIPDFVHLRVRSKYSLLESSIDLSALAKSCNELSMPAVAVTDTNNMFGALEFAHSAQSNGVQPIQGCSVTYHDPDLMSSKDKPASIVLLAQNSTGYQNLLKLNTSLYLDPDKSSQYITLDELEQHHEGLICLTGGSTGPFVKLFLNGQVQEAKLLLHKFASIFKNRIYVELQRHKHPGTSCTQIEENTEASQVEMAYELGLPLVATNDVHFLDSESYNSVDLLFYIKHGGFASQNDPRRILTAEHDFKSQQAMVELFNDLPEAIVNTVEIAQRCTFNTAASKPILPKFCEDEDEELLQMAQEGLDSRLRTIKLAADREVYKERLHYELDIIKQIGFSGYFLIVHDFVVWAKKHNIPVGPGRGSGAGSLAAYALRITNLDPIRYSLLFERFLNPERNSIPDFDIDFCQDRRDEVIEHVRRKYGSDKVAQIITFGTLGAKGAIRDIGRILRIPRSKLNRLSAVIDPRLSLKDQKKSNGVLSEAESTDTSIQELFAHIENIEGLPRNPSRHAAGIVIGNQPIDQLIPLYNDDKENIPVTQFDMKWVEKAGLVKMDLLGLKTLSVISLTLSMLQERGIEIDIENISYDDPEVYDLYASGQTVGVFQVEGTGMVDALRKMRPSRIEDIIAIVALYRPGPMENIHEYCMVKNGHQKPKKFHELIDNLLTETNGIIVYQEQVMEIARLMGGYSLGRADILRRAMGKKLPEEMAREKPIFLDGAIQRGVKTNIAEDVWQQLQKFASYGFNKSHAAVYAAVSYQTAWLKKKYPKEFMASVMSYDMNDSKKLSNFANELKRMGIALEQPSINTSNVGFTVQNGKISFALDAIKHIGADAAETIVKKREDKSFKNIFDFARRVQLQHISKGAIENLVRAGAFDCVENNRRRLFESIDLIIAYSRYYAEQTAKNQSSLFGDNLEVTNQPSLKSCDDWNTILRLSEEQSALGIYLTGHPLDSYQDELEVGNIKSISKVNRILEAGPDKIGKSAEYKVAGIITQVSNRQTRTGKRMAVITLEDRSEEVTAFVFPRDLGDDNYEPMINDCVSMYLKIEKYQDRLSVSASAINSLKVNAVPHVHAVRIYFETESVADNVLKLLENLDNADGHLPPARLMFCPNQSELGRQIEIAVMKRYGFDQNIKQAIERIEGVHHVTVT